MIDIPFVLTDAQIAQLEPCTPDNPPEVGDYIVRHEGQHYYDAQPRAREHLCRGHVCKVVAISAYDLNDVDILVLDPACAAAGPGWVLSYFFHYRKVQLRDEAL